MNRAQIGGRTIEDGDYVVVDSIDTSIRTSDVVIAIIDNKATIKRLIDDRANGQLVLKADSSFDYEPIHSHEDRQIEGQRPSCRHARRRPADAHQHTRGAGKHERIRRRHLIDKRGRDARQRQRAGHADDHADERPPHDVRHDVSNDRAAPGPAPEPHPLFRLNAAASETSRARPGLSSRSRAQRAQTP